MKRNFLGIVLLFSIAFTSCKDDDEMMIVKPSVKLLTPENSSAGVDIAPTFTWQATDPAGKELTYDFMIGYDSLKMYKQAGGLTTASYTLTDYALGKQKKYYWKVIANNGEELGESDVWNFSSIPAPGAPILTGPIEGEFIRSTLVLNWNPVEAAEGETIQYDVFLGTSNESMEKIATVNGETSYEVDASTLEIGKVYYWSVASSDLISGNKSSIAHFKKLMPGAPDEPVLISPEHSGSSRDVNVSFEWTSVTDPEGDNITYDIYYGEGLEANVLLASDLTTNNYVASALEFSKPLIWKIVAKDPSGNYTESAKHSFTHLAAGFPEVPVIGDLAEGNILSLDEAFIWSESTDPDAQAITYDVYVDEVYPPVKKVASDLTSLEFVAKNADLACDITNVKTFHAMVVAKDEDGNESYSTPISFEPQMTGIFTDKRGQEVEEYKWVRLGTQVWLADNLRTKKYTSGVDIPHIGNTKLTDGKVVVAEYFWDEYDHHEIYNGDWVADFGRVYSYGLIYNSGFAPSGWRVCTADDTKTLKSYVNSDVYVCSSPFFISGDKAGTDLYGLNWRSAGWRYPTNFRVDGVFRDRPLLWVDNNDLSFLELRIYNGEWRLATYNSKMMFGIRLVKDE